MAGHTSWEKVPLFDPGPEIEPTKRPKSVEQPVWSENKADLIARYLRYFVFITRHGTYIDAFAGPQTIRSDRAWTAQLVLESEPKWLRHFHLFELAPSKVTRLNDLATQHADRNVHVYPGNSNRVLPQTLPADSIRAREATFCLLDQRTFECEWALCEHIARLRPGPTKPEQFYFLANFWMSRALAAISTEETEHKIAAWLGDDDWQLLRSQRPAERRALFVDKFRDQLGYRFVEAWPIFQRPRGQGATMYWMIHASDHPEAPHLMARAYRRAIEPPEPLDQLDFELGDLTIDTCTAAED